MANEPTKAMRHHESDSVNLPVGREQFLHWFGGRAHLDEDFGVVEGFRETANIATTLRKDVARLVLRQSNLDAKRAFGGHRCRCTAR
jgi:hypothetical protein